MRLQQWNAQRTLTYIVNEDNRSGEPERQSTERRKLCEDEELGVYQ